MAEKYYEDGSYSCKKGIELIAKVLAGKCEMKYTKATVGEGNLEEGEDPKDQENVKGYKMDAQIAAITNPVNGECQVTIQVNSADVDEGFYATGILLYARDDDGSNIPYTYLVLENEPEWIRPRTSDIGKLATFDLIVAVGAVDKVTAVIDTDSIMTRQASEYLLDDMFGRPDDYSPDGTYKVGDTCVHDGKTYRCKTAVTEAEAWDGSKWERVDIYSETGALQAESRQARSDIGDIFLMENHNYEGRDLTQVFADEINAAEGDTQEKKRWNWIQSRINDGNYAGLHNEDWIPLKVGEETLDMQLAGMNCYTGTGWTENHGEYNTADLNPVPNHIDFISKHCMKTQYQWNTTATNSGTGEAGPDDGKDVPWLESNLKKKLDELYNTSIPEEVKEHITNKIMLLERRAKVSSGDALKASTGWHWYPMGNLWVPLEYEVFGSVVWGTPGYSSGQQIQYPLFAHSYRYRMKKNGSDGDRCDWWLASVSGFYATYACAVAAAGDAGHYAATYQFYVPLCFRIAAKA